MMSRTFILSLLASAIAAQAAGITLPSFALVTSGATIDPTSTSTVVVVVTASSAPMDDDQPAASRSIQVPASESCSHSPAPPFNQSGAPNFTLPVFSSTFSRVSGTADLSTGQPVPTPSTTWAPAPPATYTKQYSVLNPSTIIPKIPTISSVAPPAAPPVHKTFNPSEAPRFTPKFGTPGNTPPVYTSTPCASSVASETYSTTWDLSIGQLLPTSTPVGSTSTFQIPSSEEASSTTRDTSSPTPAPVYGQHGSAHDEPCTDEDERPAASATPLAASTPLASMTTVLAELPPYPTGGVPSFPAFPTGTGKPHRPGFASKRPHASGTPYRRHSRCPGPPRPSATQGQELGVGKGAAASTPCTLETRVRPTPTGI